ncbi:MAG: metallophosphoesterase [Pyrinomonadaceae bacterium]
MKKIDWKQLTKHRTLGLLTMGLGAGVLFAPIVIGSWIIALLGIIFLIAGLLQFVFVLRSEDRFSSFIPYFSGGFCVAVGLVLFLSPRMALIAVLAILTLVLFGDGIFRIYSAFKLSGSDRLWTIFNGVFSFFLGFLVMFLVSVKLGFAAIGISLGLWLLVEGWTMLLMPERTFDVPEIFNDPSEHPDEALGLNPGPLIKEVQEPILKHREIETSHNILYSVTFIALFFVIHLLRTEADWTWLGFISPFAAVIGDIVVALLLGLVVLLPLRMLWRKLSRPIERAAWNRFQFLHESHGDATVLERGLEYWLGLRLRFALELRDMRYSLNYAFWRLLRFGLPLVAVLIAVNSIWGFSWYFNSENWASAVWQELTKNRIDVWRKRAAEDVEKQAIAAGIAPTEVFAIKPDGIDESSDFAFIVIGDTGEGDPSQTVLRDQLIAAGKRDDIKFLVVSSDVIYPDGKMKDYERNFYLPFKGVEKPIYAIPGNHDWFDANEGFNANFLEPAASLTTSKARLLEDLQTDVITDDQRYLNNIAEAKRLRDYYRIDNGHQRAPFFEMHSPGFSLIAADTGILRRVDDKQYEWLEQALTRAGTNYKLVILGHPYYVAGRYTASDDEGFRKLHDLLKRHNVNAVMAGDTHDFEHYRDGDMLHFVNGGGGAYLSVGTSVAFPADPDLPDYAFYPRTDEVNAKLDRETPIWKAPFLLWMRLLGGYPFDSEMVSSAFDFNTAPFFQSFVEVRVERSQNRLRFVLHGANGPLRWRDIQATPEVIPPGSSLDGLVEFIAPLTR